MGMNKVLFEGNTYELDTEKYKFIARDKDGSICAYVTKPHSFDTFDHWVAKDNPDYIVLRNGVTRWRNSCQEIEKLIVNESKDVGVHPPFRYNGFIYENVAKDLKWIATDENGRVYAYDTQPIPHMQYKHWYDRHQLGECDLLATERPCEFFKWTGSLLEIEEILKHEN